MKWLKLHTEARTDAKLDSLPDDEFRVWFRLLCFASDQPGRGLIAGYSPRLLAVEVARGDVALLQRTLTSLVELRIISEGGEGVSFLHWQERQYDKPSDQPEAVRGRVAAFRARQKDVTPPTEHTPPADEGVTEGVCNADVTRSNALDTDTDTDTESEYTPLPPTAPADQDVAAFTSIPRELDARQARATRAALAATATRPVKCPTWEQLPPPFRDELRRLIRPHASVTEETIRRQIGWFYDKAGRELRTLPEWQSEVRALVQNEIDKWLPSRAPTPLPVRPVRSAADYLSEGR